LLGFGLLEYMDLPLGVLHFMSVGLMCLLVFRIIFVVSSHGVQTLIPAGVTNIRILKAA